MFALRGAVIYTNTLRESDHDKKEEGDEKSHADVSYGWSLTVTTPMPSLVLTSSLTQLLYDARRTIMLKAGLTRVLSEGATFLLVALKHISHPSFEVKYAALLAMPRPGTETSRQRRAMKQICFIFQEFISFFTRQARRAARNENRRNGSIKACVAATTQQRLSQSGL